MLLVQVWLLSTWLSSAHAASSPLSLIIPLALPLATAVELLASPRSGPLSFRAPHESRYAKGAAPLLTPADLEGFVQSEASAAGLSSTLIETVAYGLAFFLFELRPLGLGMSAR